MFRFSTYCFLVLLLASRLTAADYYWVGGSGNWSDITHWVTTSGGTAQHNVVPSSADNVIFDANSFSSANQIVTIDLPNVFCRDLDFSAATNNPALGGAGDNILNISGSVRLTAAMRYNFLGSLVLLSTEPAQVVDLQNHRVRRDVLFNGGASGGWVFQSAFLVDSIFNIVSGSVDFNDQQVQCNRWFIDGLTTTILSLGNSEITVGGSNLFHQQFNEIPVVDINSTNLTINPGMSRLILSGVDISIYVRGEPTVQFNEIIANRPAGSLGINVKGNYTISRGNLSIQSLELQKSTRFHYGHTINNLILSPDKNYLFDGGETYKIGSITANGSCQQPLRMATTETGVQAIFETSQGSTINFVMLQGLRVNGPTITANNSFDLGNNTNWTITEKTSETLYWVGNDGNWNDPMHWSASSGGAGGSCVPTPADDVIFDANSFSRNATVTLNTDNAFCKSMRWENLDANPAVMGTSPKELHIFGSLALHDRVNWNFEGSVYFESKEPGQTITTANKLFLKDVYFAGTGEYILQDSLNVTYYVNLNAGTLRLNGQTLVANFFQSTIANQRTLDLRNGHVLIRTRGQYNYSFFDVLLDNFHLEAIPSKIECVASSGRIYQYMNNIDLVDPKIHYDEIEFATSGAVYFAGRDNEINKLRLFGHTTIYPYNFANTLKVKIGLLHLNREHLYQFGEFNYTIDSIVALGSCGGVVALENLPEQGPPTFVSDRNQELLNVIIKNIAITGGAQYIVRRSKLLGNSPGWTLIDSLLPRTLYWVNGSGDWNQTAHWSLTSGGGGGQCIPTPIDDVIFDRNSFGVNERVNIYEGTYSTCHNFTWDGPPVSTYLNLQDLFCFGSFKINTNLNNYVISELFFRGDSVHEVSTQNHFVYNNYIQGTGSFELKSSYRGNGIYVTTGTLNTNSQPVELEILFAYGSNATHSARLVLGSSTITLSGSYGEFTPSLGVWTNASVQPGQSQIFFTGSNPYVNLSASQAVELNNLFFTNSSGVAIINSNPGNRMEYSTPDLFNLIHFSGDGEIIGANSIDSLIYSPGHAYILESEKVQQVREYFRIRGNNCAQIKLSSSIPGKQAIVEKLSGTVDGDFIQMRDQLARGGASFFAGNNSEGIANNTGWVFGTGQEYVDYGILGEDRVTCAGDTLVLNENNTIGAQSFQWSTNQTTPSVQITRPGRYWVEADYGNNCILRDSIIIINPQDFVIPLGPDTTICSGTSFSLDGTIDLLGVTYTWEDGSTSPQRTIDAGGTYTLSATLTGCTTTDSININYTIIPDLNIDEPRDLCAGDTVLLSINVPGATYRWNTGATTPMLTATTTSWYIAEAQVGQCVRLDSTFLDFVAAPVFDFGVDRSICLGDSFNLQIPHAGASIQWFDGDLAASKLFHPQTTQFISAIASFGRCQAVDTMMVEVKPLPVYDLGADSTACDGESITTQIPLTGVQIVWDDGLTDSVRTFNQSVSRSVQVTLNGCTVADRVNYTFVTPPVFDLGVDQTICFGDSVILAIPVAGATVIWEDGQTMLNRVVKPQASQTVTAVAAFGRCASFDTTFIQVNPLPDFTLGPDSMACIGESITLDIPLTAATIQWTDGSTEATRTFTMTSNLAVDVTENGCTKREDISLTFVAPPNLDLNIDSLVICEGESIRLGQDISGAHYEWQDGRTTAFVQDTPETSLIYRLIAGFGHCLSEDSVHVVVNPLPRLFLGTDRALCPGTNIILEADHNGTDLLWEDNTTALSREITQPGTYFAQVRLGQCMNYDTVRITTTTTNFISLGPDTVICSDKPLRVSAGTADYIYSWSTGESNAEITVSSSGEYGLTVFDGNCFFRDTINVVARQCTYFTFFAPNAFSPNGDGVNDLFTILFPPGVTIQQYVLEVYDRYGNLIFSSPDHLAGWDGTRSGQSLTAGVYVYRVSVDYTDDNGSGTLESGGDVTIIR